MLIRHLGIQPYLPVWDKMQKFTQQRNSATEDEIWLLQHPPIFTLGRHSDESHILLPGSIPVQRIDRGGQVTYHGPGQLIIYLLWDLKRAGLGVRQLVSLIENSLIEFLAQYQIKAFARADAPGVYTSEGKIAALGLRIKKYCSFHGLSLNYAMDLSPFQGINPCGHAGMQVVQFTDYHAGVTMMDSFEQLASILLQHAKQ